MIKRLYKGRTRKVFFLSLLFMFILSSSLYLDRDLNTQSTSDSGSDLIQNRRSDLEEGLGDEDILADDEIYNDDQTTHQTPRASDDANWWDEDFDRRLKLNVEEPGIGSREDEPVTYHAEFENSSCHINSTRIVKYQGGSQTEIPSQIWNIELWQENGGYSDYIKSCNITFMISISMSAINTYYLYYSSLAMNNNTQQYYSQTGFVSTLSGGRATVDTGELYSEFG